MYLELVLPSSCWYKLEVGFFVEDTQTGSERLGCSSDHSSVLAGTSVTLAPSQQSKQPLRWAELQCARLTPSAGSGGEFCDPRGLMSHLKPLSPADAGLHLPRGRGKTWTPLFWFPCCSLTVPSRSCLFLTQLPQMHPLTRNSFPIYLQETTPPPDID